MSLQCRKMKFLFTVVYIKHYRYSLGSSDLQWGDLNLNIQCLAQILIADVQGSCITQPGRAGTKMKLNHEDHEEHKDKNRINGFMVPS